MTLECSVVAVDTSRPMTNEDIGNTRFYYQRQIVDKISQSKFNLNQENVVSVLDMSSVNFLTHYTKSLTGVLRSIHNLKPTSSIDIFQSIKTAMLALKHRPEKNHRLRIVLNISSSANLTEEQKNNIMSLSKSIKKQKIGLDIIVLGIESPLKSFFETFILSCNGPDDLCSFFVIEKSSDLKDFENSKALKYYRDGTVELNNGEDMDIDNDPQLALALKLSLQDQMQEAKNNAEANKNAEKKE